MSQIKTKPENKTRSESKKYAEMKVLEPILVRHPFLEGFDARCIAEVCRNAHLELFRKGQYLFRECEEANDGYLVCRGKVAIEAVPGKTLQTVLGDEVVGWSWLVPPYFWRFDAKALEPTEVIVLDGKELRKQCEEFPLLGYQLLKKLTFSMSQRLEILRLQLLEGKALN